jgi:hypothetical protein
MSLRLSRLVPDENDQWYYHEEAGLLLHNNFEYGWTAVSSLEKVKDTQSELNDAIESVMEDGGEIADADEVLPLPDDYEHANPPIWEQ